MATDASSVYGVTRMRCADVIVLMAPMRHIGARPDLACIRTLMSTAVGMVVPRDGVRGMQRMYKAGSRDVAQEEATSIVFDVPGQVLTANAVDQVAALPVIAQRGIGHLRRGLQRSSSA